MTVSKSYAAVVGNALEMYDFSLYGIFSPILGTLFFPSQDPRISLLIVFSVYATGFIMRPLGAIFFGHLGDRKGRKPALVISMILMAISTIMIGILPSYDEIGILAPILLVFSRLLQGLSAGGEYIGASLFAMEHAVRKGFAGALVSASGGVGTLIALSMGYLLLNDHPSSWRILFLLGGGIGGISLYLRYKVSESPEFISIKKQPFPILKVIAQYPSSFLKAIGVGGFQAAVVFNIFTYINVYPFIEKDKKYLMALICIGSFLTLTPIVGRIADRFGAKKILMGGIWINFFLVLIAFKGFLGGYPVVAAFLLGSLASGVGAANLYMYKLFPVECRYSGISVGYGIGSALFGGTLPLVSTYFNHPLAPAYYLMLVCLISLMSLGHEFLRRKGRQDDE
ncbi:MAG: MHS family MFS transporter [Alphaproteobacteria bacterium]|nr:MHS family MFS transporter [Alphaproteobacteria bacterium]